MTNLQSMDNLNYCYASAEAEKAVSTQESTASGTKCPHCGATIPEDCEICPACGRRIVSYCTFCGSPIEWSDSECPECVAPADGIRCPSCGTLSFRSFCPKCNTPVTKAAGQYCRQHHPSGATQLLLCAQGGCHHIDHPPRTCGLGLQLLWMHPQPAGTNN